MSKHGGGGRYNAVIEIKGSKKREKERKKRSEYKERKK
jgi:hypothetical protein